MEKYKEWIIKYHGCIEDILKKRKVIFEVISEKYAILQATSEMINKLTSIIEIEVVEESSPIYLIKDNMPQGPMKSYLKKQYNLSGEGVTVGWISHKETVNYTNYKDSKGESRVLYVYDGVREYKIENLVDIYVKDNSNIELCVGDNGIAHRSPIILVNLMNEICYSADIIRAVYYILGKIDISIDPLVIYIPFDISRDSLVKEIISNFILQGKLVIVCSAGCNKKIIDLNCKDNICPIYSYSGPVVTGLVSLIMEWGIIKKHNPYLYGQKLRTYFLKKLGFLMEKDISQIDSVLSKFIVLPQKNLLNRLDRSKTLDLVYEFIPDSALIDVFITYNNLKDFPVILEEDKATLYPLAFPYFGMRGTVTEIKEILSGYLQALVIGSLAYILSNEPFEIKPLTFSYAEIFSSTTNLKGRDTLVAIIDTGIDYTNPVFIDPDGNTRIVGIWDQTIEGESSYGYGAMYDEDMINKALHSPDPYKVVPHKDTVGSGTMLAGIAAGYRNDGDITYKGVAPESNIIVVKLDTALPIMQEIYHGSYNSLAVSSLDLARGLEYVAVLANKYQQPTSICIPSGTNTGSHDGNSIFSKIIMSYAEKPGISVVMPAGEEANKKHHARGDLTVNNKQEIGLNITENQSGFVVEIWVAFGDRIEATLIPPKSLLDGMVSIPLDETQMYNPIDSTYIWVQGSRIDSNTGSQVIRFRIESPLGGRWTISVRGLVVVEGRFDIWIPKAGMILPGTVLEPADPFTTIYNTSASKAMTIACYDPKSSSVTPSSGRGFSRDGSVKPDFMVPATDIPGPLPDNRWALVTGTAVASAIIAGFSSIIYEYQLEQGEDLANTIVMKSMLIEETSREPTVSYPNSSWGYGLIDIATTVY